jgi:hypothetical protein
MNPIEQIQSILGRLDLDILTPKEALKLIEKVLEESKIQHYGKCA